MHASAGIQISSQVRQKGKNRLIEALAINEAISVGERMARIAFIDNQSEELGPIRALLEGEAHSVETYRNATYALAAFQRRMPDLVVIILSASRTDGVALVDRILSSSFFPIILLSSTRDEIDEIMGLRFGADDYIHKPVSPRLLAERINAHLRRHALLTAYSQSPLDNDKQLVCGDLSMDPVMHTVIWKNQSLTFTATEFRMLATLIRRPGMVKSREQLMTEGYVNEVYVYDRTIDSHIKRIRAKLRAIDPTFDCIQTLYGIGYRFVFSDQRPDSGTAQDMDINVVNLFDSAA